MITPENIIAHELIGLNTEIIDSSHKDFIGLNGTIIDETKFMFVLNMPKGYKKIPKANNKWRFSIQNQHVILNGSDLCKRSYDRLGLKQ